MASPQILYDLSSVFYKKAWNFSFHAFLNPNF